ncbi:hypothetical protein HanXRQr2_Chr16g0747191 [Helianthus annuus]|uniref:Uncharacterized protein n=1 Tax=Helianthus annuus TaxID=4232 RepID=A0A9K3DSZ6_HELAN|nr:hypothetical protein HanXRQr2_Chr16g0747191 [Helianthus annuus]KAJ0821120.1 hypothetical protein HanPSC8_Chr16g0716291 [Helianthus annuus]
MENNLLCLETNQEQHYLPMTPATSWHLKHPSYSLISTFLKLPLNLTQVAAAFQQPQPHHPIKHEGITVNMSIK